MKNEFRKSERKIWSRLLLLFLFLTSFSMLNAQVTVTGKVISEEDESPVPGVNIIEKGTSNGVITNVDGTYSIAVGADAVLQFSFVGMVTQEIAVGAQTIIDVNLSTGATSLDEIVVIGYGTASKATLTGAVASVRGDELKQSPSTNFSNTLVGRVPGLFAVNRSGEPGYDGATLRIRGANTLGDNNPLVVVDGIPNRNLERLDPAVIESFTVLKDASAAIYGTQAANGVILITTKRGKIGKPTVTIDMNVGAQQPTVIPEMANAATYATQLNEISYYNDPGAGMNQVYSEADIQAYADGSDPWGHPNTDWFDEVFKPWSMQHYENISVRGGSENMKYFLSFGNKYQDAVYYNSATYYSQQDFRTNIDGKVSEYIDLSFDVAARSENRHFPTVSQWDSFRMLMRGKPTMPGFWPNGDPGPDIEYGTNPVVTTTDATGYNEDKNYYLQTNLRLNITIPGVKGLAVQANVSYDKHFRYQKVFETPWYLYTWDGNPEHITEKGKRGLDAPQLTQRSADDYKLTYNAYVTYDVTANNHAFKIMAGTENQQGLDNWMYAFRKNFISGEIDELFAGATDQYMANDGSASNFARRSYFGRFNYAYGSKYLAEVVMRYDGSYMFDDAWGFFPGISLGWRISDEAFWADNISFFQDFKLRSSWGQTGNDRIFYDGSLQEYKYLTLYGFVGGRSYVFDQSIDNKLLYEQAIPNPDVTWEVANQFNVGFTTTFFNSHMTFEADYFHNLRTNILWQRNASVPESTGLTLPPENIGEVLNQGFEFVVDWRGQSGSFRYNISLNGSYAHNEILFWDETPGRPEYQQSTGSPMGAELLYEAIGIFETQADVDAYPHWAGAQPGDVIFEDVNGDGIIDGLDRVRQQNTGLPFFTGGLSASMYWKNFDFSILFQGTTGAVAYINPESGEIGNYYQYYAGDRWTPTNPSSEFPRSWNRDNEYWRSQDNTYWQQPMDYLRLKNMELGYNIPMNSVKGIAALRVYANGLNLLTWDKIGLIDPELTSGQAYPLQRIVNLGLTVTF